MHVWVNCLINMLVTFFISYAEVTVYVTETMTLTSTVHVTVTPQPKGNEARREGGGTYKCCMEIRGVFFAYPRNALPNI